MKKGILITLTILGAGGLGYFIYRKFADRNKKIIQDGSFTIKVDETASTGVPTPQDFAALEGDESSYYDYSSSLDDIPPSWWYTYDDSPNPYDYSSSTSTYGYT